MKHRLLPLNRLKPGASARIRELAAQPDLACRLRELGFCEGRCITALSNGDQMICKICSARLALSGRLAECVLVEAGAGHTPHASGTLWRRARSACGRWFGFGDHAEN